MATTKILVALLAFCEEKRIVEIPFGPDTSVRDTLQEVFHYGQNDVQPQNHPSVSVGDVAFVGHSMYICQSVGWAELTIRELADHMRHAITDRTFYAEKIGAVNYD